MYPQFESNSQMEIKLKTNSKGILFIDPCYLDEIENVNESGQSILTNIQGEKIVTVHYSRDAVTALSIKLENGYPSYWNEIGECPVDSGQIIIIGLDDLKHWIDGDFGGQDDDNDYHRICTQTVSDDGAGYITLKNESVVVGSSSGYGDGTYKVYAGYNRDNEPISAIIVFKEEEEEEDFEDDNESYDEEDEEEND